MRDACASDLHSYRLYLLDGEGHIRAARDLQAATDECALWVAANLGLSHAAELWRRGRRIAAFDAAGAVKT